MQLKLYTSLYQHHTKRVGVGIMEMNIIGLGLFINSLLMLRDIMQIIKVIKYDFLSLTE
jgi:hypothetical protein